MLSQPLKTILVLFLFTLGYCSAMDRIVSAQPDSWGVRIEEATCNKRKYSGYKIGVAAVSGARYLEQMKKEDKDLGLIMYKPKIGEEMPFEPPYFYIELSEGKVNEPFGDFVVITRGGRVVKVVSQIRIGSSYHFVDCHMKLEETLAS